jgi:hypothetical protein
MQFNDGMLQKAFDESNNELQLTKERMNNINDDIRKLAEYLKMHTLTARFELETDRFTLTFDSDKFYYQSVYSIEAKNKPIPLLGAKVNERIEAHKALPQFLRALTAWIQGKDII